MRDKEKKKAGDRVYSREYYKNNPDKWAEYYAKNASRIAARKLTPGGKYSSYKNAAKGRSISFDLTLEEFITFWQKPCEYCGVGIDTIGVDRVDSSQGYSVENCVPCCKECNLSKLNRTKAEFVSHMIRTLKFQGYTIGDTNE